MLGSIGNNEEPARVFPGKKMAGHMGNDSATAFSLKVLGIDTEKSLLFIKGAIPGNIGGLVKV